VRLLHDGAVPGNRAVGQAATYEIEIDLDWGEVLYAVVHQLQPTFNSRHFRGKEFTRI
jgi:hypothetical protein